MDYVIVAVIAIVIAVILAWAYFTAQRLNRLHIRIDSSLAQLEAALDRRAAVAAALEPSLREAARAAESTNLKDGAFEQRSVRERELTADIARAFPQRPAELVEAETRVQLAHRFYNEAVSDTRALRLRPLVRGLRLGGTARLPEFFEFVGLPEAQ